jgi:DNA polymerase-3 subunit alpha (Gram-positive type)
MTTNSLKLLNELSFCVFDLETTGGNHLSDKIIEIGLVKIENLKIIDQKGFLIRPEIHIPDFIQKLTNIKETDVVDAPLIEEVIDEILEFMGDSILVAHNTSFDIPFFNSVLRRMGKAELQNKSICTNLMTKYMIPNILSSNLNYMSKIFDFKHQKAHRALDDALASAELLLKYLTIFIHKKIHKINSLYYPKNKFELDRIHYKKDTPVIEIISQIETLSTPVLVTLKGPEGTVLFSFPSLSTPIETAYLSQKIREIPFEILTIKMIGPFFQGLIEMSSYFPKISEALQTEAIQKLCEFHQISYIDVAHEDLIEFKHDFVIMNHLIPEQYVIYPLSSLQHKMELVFRYPTHQNKLVQYINSKSLRMTQGKLKKDHLLILIHNFLSLYLYNSSNYLLITKDQQKIVNGDIKDSLEAFVANNPNLFHFPQKYL